MAPRAYWIVEDQVRVLAESILQSMDIRHFQPERPNRRLRCWTVTPSRNCSLPTSACTVTCKRGSAWHRKLSNACRVCQCFTRPDRASPMGCKPCLWNGTASSPNPTLPHSLLPPLKTCCPPAPKTERTRVLTKVTPSLGRAGRSGRVGEGRGSCPSGIGGTPPRGEGPEGRGSLTPDLLGAWGKWARGPIK
jgi:hypothetical protein